jgi:hypothetical protein
MWGTTTTAISYRKDTTMKRHFCEEYVFGFIWEHADRDGIWDGDDATIAAEFSVLEDEAYDTLSDLTDRDRIQRIGTVRYIVTRWREREELGGEYKGLSL